MQLRDMIRQAMQEKGLDSIKDAARRAGVSGECLRLLLSRGRIPKDSTLLRITDSLGLDSNAVLVAAHRERLPAISEGNMLQPSAAAFGQRRKWPFSQEQCEYLGTVMNGAEVQLLRKYRQVSGDGKIQIRGHIEYLFAMHRSGLRSGGDT